MKKVFVLIIIFISLFKIYSESNINYGDSSYDIKKSIYKSELIDNNMSLEIVDIKYIEDSKVIGFINGNRLGVCVFEKSEDNKYILNTLQVINYQTTYNQFLIHYGENLERAIVIISTGEDISKVKITVNNKYNVIQDLDTKKPSMTIFNKNQININDDKVNYYLNFFDLDGKEINDSNI